ncbi:hypothetical protein [Streptomyces sp. NBC_00847]|uniref:hypothetical protein n=1 Tax=Streptomyces sp. NBC_00847 TaxID=2975850 RepID=UPI00225E0E8F|nr:hypothetical protein [Streptomyces sp. NBC_00847]MCX4885977.1 hypothetical protein [Streptomyces sp. NBC_00847]
MFKRKNSNDRLLADLHEAALRAIWRLEKPDGPEDVNPHTASVTSYSLASMLTFSADGSPISMGDAIDRVAHMIYAGKPERRETRRDWLVWELERLGRPDDAARLARLVDTHGGTRAL